MNRKNAIKILKHRKEFETMAANNFKLYNIITNANLCLEIRKIFNRCYKLKKENIIEYAGITHNGSVVIQKIGDEESYFIEHFEDIDVFIMMMAGRMITHMILSSLRIMIIFHLFNQTITSIFDFDCDKK